jgi:3,4-dihydroxy-9,10-secoandrosta-1,3,5(10)-triene-9,17-dione 4,5-dioxygenase
MIDIKSMGYVRVASTDLSAWPTFAEKVLGLAAGRGPTEGNLYYRIDEVSARLVVFPSDVDRLEVTGWELADHEALQNAREHLTKAGVEFEEGTAEELAERRVQELIRFTDPFDNVFELFHGITYEARPVVTPYAATFVTGTQGMGHIVVPVTDDVEALRFYRDVLGFRLRDSMSMPGEFVGKEPGSKVWLRFLGVNPRHHSLAFLPMPNPSRCVHIMFEVEKLDDVGRALERVRKYGAPLSATLGRHMNDEMVSFYVRSPGGFDVEFGCEGLTVDDDRWVARESTAVSYWGHVFGGPSSGGPSSGGPSSGGQ